MAVIRDIRGQFCAVIGANQLVDGATTIARAWGVSDLVIGVTIVAEESEYLDTYTRITFVALAPMALVLFGALTYRDQIRNRET